MTGYRLAPLFRLFSVLSLVLALPAVAAAQESMARLSVLPGWRAAPGVHVAALRISLAPGWKTYWRAPGDAGIPPELDLRGARNLTGAQPLWPTPIVFRQGGMRSIGYKGELVLPLRVAAKAPGKDIRLTGRFAIGVCQDVCVPVTLDFDKVLPAAKARPDPRIQQALADMPLTAADAGVGKVSCRVRPGHDGMEVIATIEMPRAGGAEIVLLETDDPEIWVAEGESTRQGDTLRLHTRMAHVLGDAFAINRAGLRLTVLGRDRAVDIKGCPAP
jgi:DsbC/DsbD-like thiol-disulfide interchange protein